MATQTTSAPRRPRRWPLILLACLLLTLAALGHYFYWYAVRWRPATPSTASMTGKLWADPHFSRALWLPYPHQNLPALGRETGFGKGTIAALARLAGMRDVDVPGFGPLTLPPANSLALAADDSGEHVMLVAQVYPAFAGFARLAGWLAGNPWLAGGQVTLDSRQIEIAWHGRTWSVGSPALAELAESAGEVEIPPSAMAVRGPKVVETLPAGRLLLHYDAASGALELSSPTPVEMAGGEPLLPDLGTAGAVLLALAGGQDSSGPAKGLALFAVDPDQVTELPRAAAFFEVAEDRWPLPAEDILEVSGRRMSMSNYGSLHLAAFEDSSFSGAQRLAPAAAAWTSSPGVAFAGWMTLRESVLEMRRLSRGLETSPLIPRSQRQRWRDLELVLSPLADHFDLAELLVMESPSAVRLRLTRRGPLAAEVLVDGGTAEMTDGDD